MPYPHLVLSVKCGRCVLKYSKAYHIMKFIVSKAICVSAIYNLISDLCTINSCLFAEGCIFCLQTVGLSHTPDPSLPVLISNMQLVRYHGNWKGLACKINLSFRVLSHKLASLKQSKKRKSNEALKRKSCMSSVKMKPKQPSICCCVNSLKHGCKLIHT